MEIAKPKNHWYLIDRKIVRKEHRMTFIIRTIHPSDMEHKKQPSKMVRDGMVTSKI
jgi:hypothetical protein